MTQPVRIGSDLFESARRTGAAQERSAAQQISYWARIGRELEASTSLTVAAQRRLADAAAYDDMSATDQAVVRAQWEAAIGDVIAQLDLRKHFADAGKQFAIIGKARGAAEKVAVAPAKKRTRAKAKA
jgi:hypothetical protein